MNKLSPNYPMSAKRSALVVIAVLLLIFGALAMAPPLNASADAGGWPTATPTFLPTLTPTQTQLGLFLEPTTPLLPFPATPTFTPVVPAFLSGSDNLPQIQADAATPPPQSGAFSLLSCWPFAVVVLLVLIAGVLWLRSRVRQGI